MNKEALLSLGLTEEQANKVMDSLGGDFVANTDFQAVSEENKTLQKSLAERDKQLEDLKKSSGDNAELQKKIEALQQQNAEQKKAHEAELAQLRLDTAVDAALAAAGARNAKAVKALLDLSGVKLGEDGELTGWTEQLAAVRKSDGYLFADKQPAKPSFRGFQPGKSDEVKPGVNVDLSKMTYEELADYIENNPDAK